MDNAPAERAHRLKKLQRLQSEGRDPFALQSYSRTHRFSELVSGFRGLEGRKVRVAGRLMAMRRHGKSCFSDLHDETGRVQVQARFDVLGEARYAEFLDLDLGDLIGVEGELFRTRTGEITVSVEKFTILAKALRPLPEKYHGLRDVETRSRRRYLDLIMNREAREVVAARSRMVQAARTVLLRRGFIEVDTPVLQPVYGGAAARPFTSYHNELRADLYLRIAPELYLKRLIIGGLDRVFEIGRVFRNEGVDARHNPEFTLLEAYQAYADYEDMMNLTERIVYSMAIAGLGRPVVTFRGTDIDLRPPWRRVSYFGALEDATGVDFRAAESDADAVGLAGSLDLGDPRPETLKDVIDRAFEQYVQQDLVQPTFVLDYPVAISPLAKRRADDPRVAARFEPIIGTEEVGNAFSELNDPIDQRQRFEYQASLREKGDLEAHPLDEEFLLALEYGMPPTGGLGLGIERLAMIILNKANIRDVVLFPLLRPEDADA